MEEKDKGMEKRNQRKENLMEETAKGHKKAEGPLRREFDIRTDLALEEKESFEGNGGELPGVVLKEKKTEGGSVKLTEVRILNEQGARAMGKPVGAYLTLEADELQTPDEDYHSHVADELAEQLKGLMKAAGWNEEKAPSLLVVGLGNRFVTPDSLGPRAVGNLRVTSHLVKDGIEGRKQAYPALSAIAPGVMAQTGMETAQILHGIIQETEPDLVIAIDALAARSVRRLATTIQLTDTGIHPGSGVGNHRHSLTRESLGVPVIAIGVPTVVGAAAIVHDTISALLGVLQENESSRSTGEWIRQMDPEGQYQLIRELLEPEFGPMYVTPPDIDQSVQQLSFTISEGIHRAVFENGKNI